MTTHDPSQWARIKDGLRMRWPDIDQDELEATHGDREQLVSLLESSVGLDRDAASEAIETAPEYAGLTAQDIPTDLDTPPEAADAHAADEYAAGEQGESRIGDEGTPMADASAHDESGNDKPMRRAS